MATRARRPRLSVGERLLGLAVLHPGSVSRRVRRPIRKFSHFDGLVGRYGRSMPLLLKGSGAGAWRLSPRPPPEGSGAAFQPASPWSRRHCKNKRTPRRSPRPRRSRSISGGSSCERLRVLEVDDPHAVERDVRQPPAFCTPVARRMFLRLENFPGLGRPGSASPRPSRRALAHRSRFVPLAPFRGRRSCAVPTKCVIDLVFLEERGDSTPLAIWSETPRERSITLAKSNVTSFAVMPKISDASFLNFW